MEDIVIRGFTQCQECWEYVPNKEMSEIRPRLCNICYCEELLMSENDDYDFEAELDAEDERREECICGAYAYSKKTGHLEQVADCAC